MKINSSISLLFGAANAIEFITNIDEAYTQKIDHYAIYENFDFHFIIRLMLEANPETGPGAFL